MSYNRVIPRDLFNEASLLKCYGQLYLELENMGNSAAALLEDAMDLGDHFRVEQDENDGSIYIANVPLCVRECFCHLSRPLNSRAAYPLYLTTPDDEVIPVFTDSGHFTPEMKAFLQDD